MSLSKKILITAPVHPFLVERLRANNYEVIHNPTISYEELLTRVGEIEGLVVTTRLKIDKAVLNAGEQLKWIGRLGSGMELIDVDFATQKEVARI